MGEGVHTVLVKDIAPPPGYERSVDAPPPIAGQFTVAMTEPAYGPRDRTHRTRLEESPKLSLGQVISSDRGLAGRLVSARIPSDYALTVRVREPAHGATASVGALTDVIERATFHAEVPSDAVAVETWALADQTVERIEDGESVRDRVRRGLSTRSLRR